MFESTLEDVSVEIVESDVDEFVSLVFVILESTVVSFPEEVSALPVVVVSIIVSVVVDVVSAVVSVFVVVEDELSDEFVSVVFVVFVGSITVEV